MSGEKLSLFTSIAVNKQPKTDKQTELVRLITNQVSKSGIGNFSQLVQDLDAAGIVIGKDRIAIKAKQTDIVDNNGNTIAMFSNGKLNASLIDAESVVTDGLQANTIDAKNATINNLIVNNAQVTGKITATSGKIAGFDIDGNNLVNNESYNSNIILINKDGTTACFGSSAIYGSSGIRVAGRIETDTKGRSVNRNIALYLRAVNEEEYKSASYTRTFGNKAVYCVDGVYQGFRLQTGIVESDMNLDSMDNVLICTNTSEITLTPPSSHKIGQMYIIYQAQAKVNVPSSGTHYIYDNNAESGKKNQTTWHSNTMGQIVFLLCGTDLNWYAGYSSL